MRSISSTKKGPGKDCGPWTSGVRITLPSGGGKSGKATSSVATAAVLPWGQLRPGAGPSPHFPGVKSYGLKDKPGFLSPSSQELLPCPPEARGSQAFVHHLSCLPSLLTTSVQPPSPCSLGARRALQSSGLRFSIWGGSQELEVLALTGKNRVDP